MKQIVNEFGEANFYKKLAIVADLATILGVSIATFVAGQFLSEVTGLGFSASEFAVAVFFYFIFFIIFVGILSVFWSAIQEIISKNYGNATGYFFLAFFFLAMYSSFVPGIKNFAGDIFGNRYMLPKPAQLVVSSLLAEKMENSEGGYLIKGKVSFKKDVEISDYVIALYGADSKTGVYVLHAFNNSQMFEINGNGDFNIPSVAKDFRLDDSYVVVFRELDSKRGAGSDFPNYLTVIPNIELGEAGAFVQAFKPKG